jgi:hypothetical protein
MRALTLIILLLNVLCYQGVSAEIFEIVRTNNEAYSSMKTLSNDAWVQLEKGEWLYLKTTNGAIYRLEGPYDDKKSNDKDVGTVIKTILTPGGKNNFYQDKTWKGNFNWAWQMLIQELLGIKMFPEYLFMGANHPHIPPAMNAFWTLTPRDKNFCYSIKQGFNVNTSLYQGEPVVLTWTIEGEQALKKESEGIVTLHQMPDKTWDSKTYQAMWMAEKGCYRQAELLLRVPNEEIPNTNE